MQTGKIQRYGIIFIFYFSHFIEDALIVLVDTNGIESIVNSIMLLCIIFIFGEYF